MREFERTNELIKQAEKIKQVNKQKKIECRVLKSSKVGDSLHRRHTMTIAASNGSETRRRNIFDLSQI